MQFLALGSPKLLSKAIICKYMPHLVLAFQTIILEKKVKYE